MVSLRRLAAFTATAAALVTMTACGSSHTSAARPAQAGPDVATATVPGVPAAGVDAVADAAGHPTRPVAAGVLPGAITYFAFHPGENIRVSRFSGGSGRFLDFGPAGEGDVVGVPSRDGQRFALISSPDRGAVAPGELVVVEPGGARRTLARDVAWGGGIAPSWSLDGETIFVGTTRYDVASGLAEPAGLAAGNAGYLVFSDNGSVRAYARTESVIEVAAADGSNARSVSIAGLPQCDELPTCPFAVQAVSNDGRYLALGHGTSDPGHTYTTAVILDTRTGRAVTLANTDDVRHVWFTAAGAIVHTDNAVHVHDAAWHRTATFPAPLNSTDTDKAGYHS